MKISEVIAAVEELRGSEATPEEQTRWLSRLDQRIKLEVLDRYEGSENLVFEGYTEDTSGDTELLVPAPYDELYLYHLEAEIHYRNEEMTRYNIAITRFNELYEAFRKHYNRTHSAKSVKIRYF